MGTPANDTVSRDPRMGTVTGNGSGKEEFREEAGGLGTVISNR